MDLKSFISETLVAIAEGVALARGRAPVSAECREGEAGMPGAVDPAAPKTRVTQVEFDIALTVSEETDRTGNRKAGFGIKLVEGSIGSASGSRKRDESISRIAFAVPLALPASFGDCRACPMVPRRSAAGSQFPGEA
jgi:hypothetical protein